MIGLFPLGLGKHRVDYLDGTCVLYYACHGLTYVVDSGKYLDSPLSSLYTKAVSMEYLYRNSR